MVLLGTVANVMTVLIGTMLGLILTKINDRFKETIMHGIGLTVVIIGIQMALGTESIIIVLLSILSGALIGELLRLEDIVDRFAHKMTRTFTNGKQSAQVAQAFITASLIFVVGAMAILGALDSGMRGNHGILYTKSILDGFTAIVLTSTLGIGVGLSIIPIFLYQGSIALLAAKINEYVPEVVLNQLITELTAIGGILIIAIGLNILKLLTIRVTNLLPSLFIVVIFIYIQQYLF